MTDDVLLSNASQALKLDHPDYQPLNSGVLVAWSGGLDSTVLIHILKTLSKRHGFELFAVHLDHNLRSCSASDAAWCRREAARLGIGIHIENLYIRPGNSTQNQARAQRYAALFNTADSLRLPILATAHHANDAIETALINFTRGSSLKGLTSLAAETQPETQATRLIRPLINCSRAQLEQYAASHRLSWREDPSNCSDHYERNRLRHHVVPELIKNSHDIEQLQTSLEHLRDDSYALDQIASQLFQHALLPRPALQTIAIDRNSLVLTPSSIIARILMRAHAGWNRPTLNTAIDWIRNRTKAKSGDRISLTGATATFQSDCIIIEPTIGRGPRELDARTALPARLHIETPGEIRWFNHRITWQQYAAHNDSFSFHDPYTAHFDADRLSSDLFIRGPIGNERLASNSSLGRKQIKDLWREHNIPADSRWRWPCVVAKNADENEELLWLCNLRRSPNYQLDDQTRTILTISCSPLFEVCKNK